MKTRLILILLSIVTFCPELPAQIIITEIMADVHPWLPEPEGEWIELYNMGRDTIDIQGWSFRDAADNIVVFDQEFTIPPFSTRVITNDSTYSEVESFFDYGDKGNKGNISMNNGAEYVILNNGIEDVFMFQYDDGDYYGDGYSLELKSVDFALDSVVHQNELRSGGVDGTPNEYIPSLSSGEGLPPVIITEIMADAHVGMPEPEGEWIELYNTTEDSINIENYIIKDAALNQFSIDTAIIIPPFTAKVIANDSSMSHVLSYFEYGKKANKGNISMNNGAEYVILNNGIEDIFIFSYSNGGPFGQGHSLELFQLAMAEDGIVTDDELTDPGMDGTPNFYESKVLPVDLINFEILEKNQMFTAKWESQSELNNNYYTLSISSDYRFFEDIAKVKGKGSYFSISTYEFDFTVPGPGRYYIRLSQTDYNGQSKVLGTQSILVNRMANHVQVFPLNDGRLKILNLEDGLNHNVHVFDIQGHLVKQIPILGSDGEIFIDIDLAVSGIYFYRIVDVYHRNQASGQFFYIPNR